MSVNKANIDIAMSASNPSSTSDELPCVSTFSRASVLTSDLQRRIEARAKEEQKKREETNTHQQHEDDASQLPTLPPPLPCSLASSFASDTGSSSVCAASKKRRIYGLTPQINQGGQQHDTNAPDRDERMEQVEEAAMPSAAVSCMVPSSSLSYVDSGGVGEKRKAKAIEESTDEHTDMVDHIDSSSTIDSNDDASLTSLIDSSSAAASDVPSPSVSEAEAREAAVEANALAAEAEYEHVRKINTHTHSQSANGWHRVG